MGRRTYNRGRHNNPLREDMRKHVRPVFIAAVHLGGSTFRFIADYNFKVGHRYPRLRRFVARNPIADHFLGDDSYTPGLYRRGRLSLYPNVASPVTG